jgi:hypothetical protein
MSGKKVISVLTILVLLSLMSCPLMAYPLAKRTAHDCSGRSGKSDQKQHFCCDQQAITAKITFKKVPDSALEVVKFSLNSFVSQFKETDPTASYNKPDNLFLKLSVLRI